MDVPRPAPRAAGHLRLACLAAVAGWALADGTILPNALVSMLAGVAALVAARERRHRAMGIAAGIAVGASSAGLALLPVLLGAAIARRAVPRAAAFLPALAVTVALVGWAPATDASLVGVLPADLLALLVATAIGTAAWIGASCAARSPSPDEIDAAALLACLTLPLLAPVGVEAAGLAVALALGGTRPRLCPLARAANDDPLPLRA